MVATRHQRQMTLREATFVIEMQLSGKVPEKWKWWFSQLFYKAAATVEANFFQTIRGE